MCASQLAFILAKKTESLIVESQSHTFLSSSMTVMAMQMPQHCSSPCSCLFLLSLLVTSAGLLPRLILKIVQLLTKEEWVPSASTLL